jgi:hypothetical protein
MHNLVQIMQTRTVLTTYQRDALRRGTHRLQLQDWTLINSHVPMAVNNNVNDHTLSNIHIGL